MCTVNFKSLDITEISLEKQKEHMIKDFGGTYEKTGEAIFIRRTNKRIFTNSLSV